MKIVCIGHAAYDITIPMEEYPIENTKNRVKDRVECGGGPASNAAYLLGKWDQDVSFIGIVGNDEYGKKIKKEFESVNVNTDYLILDEKHTTTSSFIIANTSRGTRTVLTYRPSDMQMPDIDYNGDVDIILVDGQEIELSKKFINKYPNAISVIDAGRPTDEIIELSKMVNYLVCSKVFAETVTNMKIDVKDTETITSVYKKMKKIFQNEIVITLEAAGCLYEKDGVIKIMPSISIKAVDSTGAGDLFHGAFVYGLSKNKDFEDILKLANITGALATTKVGGRNSVFSKEEMKKFYHDFE